MDIAYQKMVDFARANIGAVLAMYNPRPGEVAYNYRGEKVQLVRASADLPKVVEYVKKYMASYQYYPDYPILEFNNEMTLLFIKPSWNDAFKKLSRIDNKQPSRDLQPRN